MKTTPHLEELLRSIAATHNGVRSLAVVELKVAEGETTPTHVHDHEEAYLVLAGEIVVHLGGESVTVGAGEAFTAPADEPHTVSAGTGGAHYLATTFTPSVSQYADFQRAAAPPAVSSEAHEDSAIVRTLGRAAGIGVLTFARALPGSA